MCASCTCPQTSHQTSLTALTCRILYIYYLDPSAYQDLVRGSWERQVI